MLMGNGQNRCFRRQDEVEGVAPQGFDLHGYLDIEIVRLLPEPDLCDPVPLQIEMFIAPQGRRGDAKLMVDDSLRAIVAGVEAQPLRA
jgi:hypothetical protein